MTRVYGKLTIVSRGLFLGSRPTQTEAPPHDEEEAGAQRRLHCRRYENCMTYAAAENWRGFHCGACPVTELISRDEYLKDLDGLAKFLRAWSGG